MLAGSAAAHAILLVLLVVAVGDRREMPLTEQPRSIDVMFEPAATPAALESQTEAEPANQPVSEVVGQPPDSRAVPPTQQEPLRPLPELSAPAEQPAEPTPPPLPSVREPQRPARPRPQSAPAFGATPPTQMRDRPTAERAPRQQARNLPVQSAPAPPAGFSAAVPPASSIAEPPPEISSGWRNALTGWLGAHKQYPEEARRRGEEGRAGVRFTVDRSGRVLDVALVRSTGSAILDGAVLSMLRGANLPPFPAAMTQDQVTVTIQIRYALDG